MKNIERSRVNIDIFYNSFHIFSRNKRNTISADSELCQKKRKEGKKGKGKERRANTNIYLTFYVKVATRVAITFLKKKKKITNYTIYMINILVLYFVLEIFKCRSDSRCKN